MNTHDLLLMYSTKGTEYLIAVVFLIAFIAFWRFLNAPIERRSVAVADLGGRVRSLVEGFLVPERLYFHPGHAWAKLGENSVITVGMSDFAQRLVGRPDAIRLPEVGSVLRQGERGWSLALESKVVDMLSPVEGKVVDVNDLVLDSPEQVNEDPYGGGWLLKVKVPRISANLKNLLSGALARKWMEEVGEDLQLRMGTALGPVSQDGGVPMEGLAKILDAARWDQIAREFLLTADRRDLRVS